MRTHPGPRCLQVSVDSGRCLHRAEGLPLETMPSPFSYLTLHRKDSRIVTSSFTSGSYASGPPEVQSMLGPALALPEPSPLHKEPIDRVQHLLFRFEEFFLRRVAVAGDFARVTVQD